ncbi:TatD family hydrolase [Motilibacter sp. K478]|nr:TatD family hydrolase [Motilibacter aurantiacus]
MDIADGAEGEEWYSPEQAIADAAAVGISRIVQVGCDRPGVRWAVEAAERFPTVVAGVALHPNEAPLLGAAGELDDALAEVDTAAAHERVRAVGETGLDFFRTAEDGRAVQESSFRSHIEIADRHGKALMIHDRDAHADVLRVLADRAPDRVVFHCYSGDADMARHCVERGWFLSFAGTVTFKNAEGLREALRVTPLDNVLVETDAPYLTPMPYRGRPNASYLIPHTVRVMAQVKGVPVEKLCLALAANTERAFGSW